MEYNTVKDAITTTQAPKTWREEAHAVIETVAGNNQYISSDTLIVALEEANKGLDNYSALGGVFTRAAKAGLIEKIGSQSKSHSAKVVWRSLIYGKTDSRMQRTVSGKSQVSRVLDLIKRPRGATNWELSQVALKYTSVISDLRKDGHNINAEQQQLKNGLICNTWLYTLLDEDAL